MDKSDDDNREDTEKPVEMSSSMSDFALNIPNYAICE